MSAEAHEPYEPPAPLRWLYGRFFQHIHVDESWSEHVRQSADRGVVVYAMRVLSILDFLCLDFLTKKFALPLVRFVNDLGLYILEPFGRGERRLRLKRQLPEDQALRSVIDDGASALLFLRKAAPFGSSSRRGDELEVDLILSLVRAQRTMDRPILIVPQTFVWTSSPPDRQRSFFDFFFGPTEWPGKIRVFFQFLFNYRNAVLRSGQPFDVQAFLAEHPEHDDASAADKIRYALLRRIERERALVLGPAQKSPQRIQDELVRSPRVRKHIESEAKASKRTVAQVESQAHAELDKLCANQSPGVLRVLRAFLDWVFTRIYDGIVVDEEGVERLRAAAREGAVILLPSHKSHVDYLVLSWVLYSRALMPPLIAAGENLSFFPLGWVLRRGGAFFIKRSFQGKKLYSALVDAYMRKLLVEGYPIEFFIEGGRSRTGKLLPPKYGLLTMVADASMMLGARKVFFAPISIGYERIVEERSYVHELSGGDKQSENVGDLLRTSSVLQSRYGRLYVQFGEILPFEDLVAEARQEQAQHHPDATELEPKYRRAMVQRLAHRTTYEINRVTVVTPAALVATALLANKRRGMTHSDLREVCVGIVARLERDGVRIAPQVKGPSGEVREDTLREAIALFLDARLVMQHDAGEEAIYKVLEERRLALEYYKNNILHFFVSNALIATSLLAEPGAATPVETLRERVKDLSRLFKHEFMFRADAEFVTIVDEAIASMIEADEIELAEAGVRPKPGRGAERVEMYARMLTTYFESYLLALRATAMLLDQPMARKEWVKKTLVLGQRMYLAGEIERRESLSQLKLETTLKYLRDRGLVATGSGDQLERGAQLEGRETLRREEAKLAPFLRL